MNLFQVRMYGSLNSLTKRKYTILQLVIFTQSLLLVVAIVSIQLMINVKEGISAMEEQISMPGDLIFMANVMDFHLKKVF